MAEIIIGIFGIVAPFGEAIAAPIKRQYNYLCCFDSNKKSLRDEAKNLKKEIEGLQMRVDEAYRNTNNILPKVQAWLDKSNINQVKATKIYDEMTKAPSGCLALHLRYSISKKAKNLIDAMKDQLREGCTFVEVAVPALLQPIPEGPSDEFDSRKQIEEKIMEDLKSRNVHILGICGMGGVGKTTMAERIMERARKEKLFDEVVMAVVSKPVDMPKIQGEIAGLMGLKLEDESLPVRAKQLHERLLRANRFLLILDDVWENLELRKLGIPCKSDLREGCEGCAIVLTSRNKDLLKIMEAKCYAMEILSENEAWSFFKKKVGTCLDDDSDLIPLAKEVAKKCQGLPLALTVLGTNLKDEKRKNFWADYLHQLKHANPVTMPYVENEVYQLLKLSYDYLENEDVQSLFLLCCIFPEDWNINLDDLTMYSIGIGIRMFEGMSVEGARTRVRTSFEMLKGRSLLLDGDSENHVKMHDVVRDVANFIASKEGRVDRNFSCWREQTINCTWISVVGEEINQLPIELSFPNLRLLSIYKSPEIPEIVINPSFFQGMEKLNSLSFEHDFSRSLPETTQLLKNLRTLYLNNCYSLETISIVSELSSLEILICRYCHKIAELPVGIGRLKKLKLLEFWECESLIWIAPGVISKLVQLEELEIVNRLMKCERKPNGRNSALCELEHLKNLTRLEIDIQDFSLVGKEMCFSRKIVNYKIRFRSEMTYPYYFPGEKKNENRMDLVLGKDIVLAKWIHVFLRSSHYLCADGDGSNNLDLAQVQNLKGLYYSDCSTMSKLVNITSSMDQSFGVFSFLESLVLRYLPNLEEICKLPKTSNSFGNLKELEVGTCSKLRKLFPLAMAKEGLLLLEKLWIYNCEMMEEVFANEEDERDRDQFHTITFPKLKSLELSDLPRLTTFRKGSESIKFPLLNKISIKKCGNLKSFISGSCNLNLEGHDADSFHLFCNQKVSFGSLKRIDIEGYGDISKIWCHQIPLCFFTQLEDLEIKDCNGIRSLFSSSIAGNLENLKFLRILDCKKMVKVIEDDEEMVAADQNPHLLFPKLKWLDLVCLPKLSSFCNWRCDLEEVYINNCPLLELESAILGSLSINIVNLDGIGSLFSSSIAGNLVNLESLVIRCCKEVVKVIEDIDEEMVATDQNPHLLFPKLKSLSLENLPKLQSFCNWRRDIQLLSLIKVVIVKCPLMEFFTMGSVSTPNLKYCKMSNGQQSVKLYLEDVGDLNSAIPQLHIRINQQISTAKETSTASDIQAGEEKDHEKSEIREAEQINEVSTSAEVKFVEADQGKSEIEEEEVSEESTSAQVKVAEEDHEKSEIEEGQK